MPRFDDAAGRVAARARQLRQLRRIVTRRAITAAVLVAAAAIVLWLAPPRRAPRPDILGWAAGSISADQVLAIGGSDAQ